MDYGGCSVFEDSVERHFDLGAGNAQHPILKGRVLFGGVEVAFECHRIDHPNVGGARSQDRLNFAIHPLRTVFRVEDLNPNERRRLQEPARGLWTFDNTKVGNHVFPCPRADPH